MNLISLTADPLHVVSGHLPTLHTKRFLYILRLPFTHCRRRPGIAHTDFYPAKLDKTILKRRENLERWCPLQSINHQRSPARRAPGSEFGTSFTVRGCGVVPASEVTWINLAAGMDYVDTLNGERQRNRARMVCGRYSALGRTTRGRGGCRAAGVNFCPLILTFIILSEHFPGVNGWRHHTRIN